MRAVIWFGVFVPALLLMHGCTGGGGPGLADAGVSEDGGVADARVEAATEDPTKNIPVFENGFESDPPHPGPSSNVPVDPAPAPLDPHAIAKLDGTRLYALSRYDGLAIVDVADPAHVRLLGRMAFDGEPYAFDVNGGRARVVLNQMPLWNGATWLPNNTRVVELDVGDPSAMKETTHVDLPGETIGAHARSGGLYVVTHEDGCVGCGALPGVVITSFSTSGPMLAKSDSLAIRATTAGLASFRRFVMATDQRLYLGGLPWDGSSLTSSVVDVIDVGNPSGQLTRGASIVVPGGDLSTAVGQRLDEHDGVLRIALPVATKLHVQTLQVVTSTQFNALGSVDLDVGHAISDVRLDGPRGYVVPSSSSDSIITVDLSNPSVPKTGGTFPGGDVLEPRGDRVVVFNSGHSSLGALPATVSLYDVSNVAAPLSLPGVSLGSIGVAQQERSFRLFDQEGLIAIPYAPTGECEASGIQLVDFARSGLALRGFVPTNGAPRELVLSGTRLFGLGPRQVAALDIGDRGSPKNTGELAVSRSVDGVVATSTHVATITHEPWSYGRSLTLRTNDGATTAEPLPLGDGSLACPGATNAPFVPDRLSPLARGEMVIVPELPHSDFPGFLTFKTLDVSNPLAPKRPGSIDVVFHNPSTYTAGGPGVGGGWPTYLRPCFLVMDRNGCDGAALSAGEAVVQVGPKVAFLEGGSDVYRRVLRVVDMRDPAHPVIEPPVILTPSKENLPLHVFGETVLTTRWVDSPTTPGKVRFYVDRIDLSGPARLVDTINLPGSLVLADATSSRLVTHSNGVLDLVDVDGVTVTRRATHVPPAFADVRSSGDRVFLTGGVKTEVVGGVRAGTFGPVSSADTGSPYVLAVDGAKLAVFRKDGIAVFDTSTTPASLLSETPMYGVTPRTKVILLEDRGFAALGERGIKMFRW